MGAAGVERWQCVCKAASKQQLESETLSVNSWAEQVPLSIRTAPRGKGRDMLCESAEISRLQLTMSLQLVLCKVPAPVLLLW